MEKYARSGCRERSLHRATLIPHTRAGSWGRPTQSRSPKGWTLLGPAPLPLARGQLAPLGIYVLLLHQKRQLWVPHQPWHLWLFIPGSILPCCVLPPSTTHIYFLIAQSPISSNALKTSAGSNTLLALPHKGQVLTVLTIRGPSPHCLHILQLPASTLSLEWGKWPLPSPRDLRLILVLWGWSFWSTLNDRMTHQKSKCYGGGTYM